MNDFITIRNSIGTGGHGHVLQGLVYDMNNSDDDPEILCRYALKFGLREDIEHERSILEKIQNLPSSCPYIIKLLDTNKLPNGYNPIDDSIHLDGYKPDIHDFILLEYSPERNLYDFIRENNQVLFLTHPDIALMVIIKLTVALHFLHSHNIMYRDFKTSNILFETYTNTPCLCDFSSSKVKDTDIEDTGSFDYCSPERLLYFEEAGPKDDVFGLGVVLFEMLAGRLPRQITDDKNTFEMYERLIEQGAESIVDVSPDDIPDSLKDLVRCMTYFDPERRIQDTHGLAAALKKNWTALKIEDH